MRTWTEERREGTACGPIDWATPATRDAVAKCLPLLGLSSTLEVAVELLREVEANPAAFSVTNDGGWPRCGWRPVILVSMYDGWPYWTPKPAVLVSGVLGPEWYWLDSITGIDRRDPRDA